MTCPICNVEWHNQKWHEQKHISIKVIVYLEDGTEVQPPRRLFSADFVRKAVVDNFDIMRSILIQDLFDMLKKCLSKQDSSSPSSS